MSGDAVPLILRVFTAYSPLIFLLLRTGLILTARPLKWAQKEGGGGPKNGHTKCQIIVIKPISAPKINGTTSTTEFFFNIGEFKYSGAIILSSTYIKK